MHAENAETDGSSSDTTSGETCDNGNGESHSAEVGGDERGLELLVGRKELGASCSEASEAAFSASPFIAGEKWFATS